jgi:hypothetical protein
VTLDRARTLAKAKVGPLRLPKALAEASPGKVGLERERLGRRREIERKHRVRVYTETYRAMKAAGQPLRILAEGDSWFDYPPHVFLGGVIPRLERRIGAPILNLAEPGDEVRFMLGVKQRKLLEQTLAEARAGGEPFDALLFSGGGNDVVEDPMCLWIRRFDAAQSADWHVDARRFDEILGIVRGGYEDLIQLRNAVSPDTRLFVHGYDFAIPSGRGVCHLGPWLKPTLDYRGVPNLATGKEIVKAMLRRFAAMLSKLEHEHAGVHFINAQGLLDAHPDWWHNELHPTSEGFDAFADKFHQALKAVFPSRIP